MASTIILDLDDTLIDTRPIRELRNRRRWKECVSRASQCPVFDGVHEMIKELRIRLIGIAVVTSSVSFYAENMLAVHSIEYDALVAYHDAGRRKPHPDPVVRALRFLGTCSGDIYGIGDQTEDAEAYAAAGVFSIGAGWSPSLVHDATWDRILSNPREVLLLM